MVLFKNEMKMNLKTLFIWTGCIAFLCVGCLFLYESLEDSLQDIADSYANMGAMSTAMGLDKMSLATMEGYYATEIAMMFHLGAALFAAILGTGMLSKEEGGHTAEFLNTLPVGRMEVYIKKYAALVCNILLFNVINVLLSYGSLIILKDTFGAKEFFLYHTAAFIMQLEIATVCYMISAFTKRTYLGIGLGMAAMLFAVDMMCRIIPALENAKYITPFYYCNATDIFTEGKLDGVLVGIGVAVLAVSFIVGGKHYCDKDLAA